MARRKLRAKNQTGTAVTASASPAAPGGAFISSHAAAAASAADARWLEVSDTFSHLLSCPDSSLLQGTGILDACKALDQLSFAQPSRARLASAGQQVKHLAVKALHQWKLPHLMAKLLSCSSTQPADGQESSSKWQQPGYCRSVIALLESHACMYGEINFVLQPAGQQQHEDVMQAGLLLLQSGVLQQVTLAQQQLAELLDQLPQQQQQGNQQPQLATQIQTRLLYYMIMYGGYSGVLMAFHCSQPGVAAALHAAVRAAAHLSVLWLQHTKSGKVAASEEEDLLRALKASYETVRFARSVQKLTENYSASTSSTNSSSNGGSGTSSSSCSADSSAGKECSVLADAAVLRLLQVLLAVYTRATCQAAPNNSERHSSSSSSSSSSQQFPPQQLQVPAATESEPGRPRSLLQLSEELWTVSLQHNPQQQQQQQQQSLACLELLADTLQGELYRNQFGQPAERLYQLVGHAAVSLETAVDKLPLPSRTAEAHLSTSSSSSKAGGSNSSGGSSSSSNEHQELQQLLQQSSWVLPLLLLAIGSDCKDKEVSWTRLNLQAVRICIIAWRITADDKLQCTCKDGLAAGKTVMEAHAVLAASQAAAGDSLTESGAAPVGLAAAGSTPEGVAATVVAAAAMSEAEAADAAYAIADAQLLSLGQDMYRWVSGLLHYWLLFADKQVTVLAAAVAAASAGSRGDSMSSGTASSSSNSSSSSSSSVGSHSMALYDLLTLAAEFDLLYGMMPSRHQRLPGLIPWQEHSVSIVAILEGLIRTTLAPAMSDSSSLGASAQQQEQQQQQLTLLRKHTETVLTKLITCRDGSQSTPLTLGAACCATGGVELRRHLFGLFISHFKLTCLQGCCADRACIMALTQSVVAIGCFLAIELREDYSLAAVRAAVAPWLVLVGLVQRLLADQIRQTVAAGTALVAHGSISNEGAAQELLGAVSVLVEIATVSLLRVHNEMLGCFTHPEAETYKGTRQYPAAELVGDHCSHHHQQQTHSSSSAPDGCVPIHHLQHPGFAVENLVSLPPAAGTVAGDAAGTTGAVTGGSSSSSSSMTALECVMLDDLDSWADSKAHKGLFQQAAAAKNAISSEHSAQTAGAPDRQAQSSESKPPLKVLQRVLETGLLQPLPELLHADGTALCNLLPVPWCCNNPGCSNMGCDSELVLVGGKACCCASCKVARYCGRSVRLPTGNSTSPSARGWQQEQQRQGQPQL